MPPLQSTSMSIISFTLGSRPTVSSVAPNKRAALTGAHLLPAAFMFHKLVSYILLSSNFAPHSWLDISLPQNKLIDPYLLALAGLGASELGAPQQQASGPHPPHRVLASRRPRSPLPPHRAHRAQQRQRQQRSTVVVVVFDVGGAGSGRRQGGQEGGRGWVRCLGSAAVPPRLTARAPEGKVRRTLRARSPHSPSRCRSSRCCCCFCSNCSNCFCWVGPF